MLPYLSKPYQYVSPYVKRADSLGDRALSAVDERLPAVTKPTGELYADAKSVVLFPYHASVQGRDHVLSTYRAEYKKVGGDQPGLVAYPKALLSTALVVTTEAYAKVAAFLTERKEAAKREAGEAREKVNNSTN